jgi:phosphoribosyl 1,2-cyclic phosphodiesterase
VRYGGNTACIEIRADDELIILDAGSGIRELGLALHKEFEPKPIEVSLLITHPHWDHIQGFPFFLPAYDDKNRIRIFGYNGANSGLREILIGQMATPFFPLALYDLPAGKLVCAGRSSRLTRPTISSCLISAGGTESKPTLKC